MGDEPEDIKLTADDEARELRAGLPAIYVDTWATLTWKGHIRIVLGETLYRHDQYRAAFMMELEDAERFGRHLLRAVERRRARESEEEKKDQDQESEP
jgi:hypothetical protein